MRHVKKLGTTLLCACLVLGAAATAEPHHDEPAQGHGEPAHGQPERGHEQTGHSQMQHGEPHRGPSGYERVGPPKGWDARPAGADHSGFQHNFRAARSFHVGPYHRPPGWAAHTWVYGQTLPRAYFASPYILSDYWLFALEVPPAGYEWVRDGSDALMVSIDTGEILQVEYGVFS
jgi:Ni/Co efflux regulator RcnB